MTTVDLTARYGMPESVKVEGRGAIRIITLNRPETYNSVIEEMHHGLMLLWKRIADDPQARAVVITGAGKAFSAGGDFSMFEKIMDQPEVVRSEVEDGRTLVLEILDFPLPLVAAVNGAAVGLGCAIAGLSDLVVMSEKAYLRDPHVAVGLVAADGGSLAWPYMMSMLRAKEHILFGTKILAAEALELGLANRVVPAEELMSTALELAERLAALPPQAVQVTKKAMNLHLKAVTDPVLDYAIEGEIASFATPEFTEIVQTFNQRS
jgi:enoyl-CoA hydratase